LKRISAYTETYLKEEVTNVSSVCLAHKCIKEGLISHISINKLEQEEADITCKFLMEAVEAPLLAFPASEDFYKHR